MKKIILAILLIPLASAIQFYPPSLEFNLEKNQVLCKKINFQINQLTEIRDIWAKNFSEKWSISNFETSRMLHELNLVYPEKISPEENEIELCLSGSKPGNYKGALLFRESEIGNSVIQFAIWLKVLIKDEEPLMQQEKNNTKKHSERSKNSGSSSGKVWTSESLPTENRIQKIQQLNYQIPQEKIKLSSKISMSKENDFSIILFIGASIIIVLALFFIMINGKKTK